MKNIVYMATNKINGKRYIGVTCQPLYERKGQHFHNAKMRKTKMPFHKAIRKYGRENFVFSEIQCFPSYGEATSAEKRLICELNPEYNVSAGGEGCPGYKHTEEARKIMSKKAIGRKGYWRDKPIPKSTIEARNTACSRQVICINDDLIFNSIRAAAKFYNMSVDRVSASCRGCKKRLPLNGEVFAYANMGAV